MKEMMAGERMVLIWLRIRGKGYCEERETEQSLLILYLRKSLPTNLMLSTGANNAISLVFLSVLISSWKTKDHWQPELPQCLSLLNPTNQLLALEGFPLNLHACRQTLSQLE